MEGEEEQERGGGGELGRGGVKSKMEDESQTKQDIERKQRKSNIKGTKERRGERKEPLKRNSGQNLERQVKLKTPERQTDRNRESGKTETDTQRDKKETNIYRQTDGHRRVEEEQSNQRCIGLFVIVFYYALEMFPVP